MRRVVNTGMAHSCGWYFRDEYRTQYIKRYTQLNVRFTYFNYSVDDALTLRLGDSALASTLFPLDYHSFHCGSAVRLPVKWMPPEALHEGIYSAQSDVVRSSTVSVANAVQRLSLRHRWGEREFIN